MTDWRENLRGELRRWRGARATFWWRDDDAANDTDALRQLLQLGAASGAPLALAVVPKLAQKELAGALTQTDCEVQVLAHGYAHANHAPASEKKQEFGMHRAPAQMQSELTFAFARINQLFGDLAQPVFVPPWNRMHASLSPILFEVGFRGVSTFQPRTHAFAELRQVNTHADVINWKGGKCFIGADDAAQQIIAHLEAKRRGECDADEPTGILTHHLVHDADTWRFLRELFALLREHPAAQWLTAGEAFQIKSKSRETA